MSDARAVLELLLADPEFRDEYRQAPTAALERRGMHDVARALGGDKRALQALESRESRSSLGGVFMAAAVEGVDLLAPAALDEHAAHAHAARRLLTAAAKARPSGARLRRWYAKLRKRRR
jgi:hypothetical protein